MQSNYIQNENIASETDYVKYLYAKGFLCIKSKIKNTYGVIPKKNLIKFIREAEYKFINRMKSYDEKILDFFECFTFLNNVAYAQFNDNFFLSDSNDSSSDDNSSEEDISLDN